MKTKSAPERARNQPLLNKELLRQYLGEKLGFQDPAHQLVEAKVIFFDDTLSLPYGKAAAGRIEVHIRSGHFHRISSVVPPEDDSASVPKFGDEIWALTSLVPTKNPEVMNTVALQWGYVSELPHSFMIEQTWKVRLIRKIDSHYRSWRNSSWRKELRRQSGH